jgi:flagellar biosynthesis/type III secretory pathway protein FliH
MEEDAIERTDPPSRQDVLRVLRTLHKEQFDKWVDGEKILATFEAEAKENAQAQARATLQLIDAAKQEAEGLKQRAYEAGYKEGLERAKEVSRQWQRIGEALVEHARANQDGIIERAKELAVYALGEHLTRDADFFSRYVESWLEEFQKNTRCRRVMVHPEFVERVRAVLSHFPALHEVAVEGDRHLKPGDLEVDFGGGQGAELKLRDAINQVALR